MKRQNRETKKKKTKKWLWLWFWLRQKTTLSENQGAWPIYNGMIHKHQPKVGHKKDMKNAYFVSPLALAFSRAAILHAPLHTHTPAITTFTAKVLWKCSYMTDVWLCSIPCAVWASGYVVFVQVNYTRGIQMYIFIKYIVIYSRHSLIWQLVWGSVPVRVSVWEEKREANKSTPMAVVSFPFRSCGARWKWKWKWYNDH